LRPRTEKRRRHDCFTFASERSAFDKGVFTLNHKTNSSSRVVIVDYGTGNLNSVKRALDRMGARSIVSSHREDIIAANKIIFPGVGHFGKAMSKLAELDLDDTLHEAVLIRQKPILGICLGMQLMTKRGEEGNIPGLGWLDGETIQFDISDARKYKIPHMGWNQIRVTKNSLRA